MFVFTRIDQVSDNYHAEGGLMIVANNQEHAKEMIKEEKDIEITNEEWEDVKVYDLAGDYKPRIFVFPDAGCC